MTALLAALHPAWAETFTVPAGQTVNDGNQIVDGTTPTSVYVDGGGTFILSNTANTYTGGSAVVGGSTVQIDSDPELGAAAGGITLGDLTTPGTLSLADTVATTSARPIALNAGGGTITTGPFAWTFSGVVSGPGTLTVNGAGTLVLTNTANSYTGGTAVVGGSTLQVDADTELGYAGGTVTLGNTNSGGTLALVNAAAATSGRDITLGAGGGIIDTGTKSWTFTGVIGGSGGLTVGGASALILDGANTYTGPTVVNAGELQVGDINSPGASLASEEVTVNSGGALSGNGTVFGTVFNMAGVVAPGGPVGTLTVNNYTQGAAGTLAIEVSPAGAAQLKVNGTANLDGTLKLVFDPGFYKPTTYQILTASAVNGTFSTVAGTLSAGVGQMVAYGSNDVSLTLSQLAVLPENPSLFTALTSAALDDAQSSNGMMLSRLTDARTQAAVEHTRYAESTNHRASSSPGGSPYGGWFQALGGFGSVNGNGSAPGYGTSGEGFLTGVDTVFNNGLAVGVALGYTHTDVDEHSGASGTISTPRLSLYADYWLGPVALDATLGYGDAQFNGERPILANGSTAGSSYSGNELTAAIQASTTFDLDWFVLTPAIGTKFASLDSNTATENGGGAFDVVADKATTNSLRPFISATAAARFETSDWLVIEPEVKLTYETEVLSNTRQVSVQPTGDDDTFEFDGVSPSRSTVGIDAGVAFEVSRTMAFYTDVNVERAGNGNSQALNAGVKYEF